MEFGLFVLLWAAFGLIVWRPLFLGTRRLSRRFRHRGHAWLSAAPARRFVFLLAITLSFFGWLLLQVTGRVSPFWGVVVFLSGPGLARIGVALWDDSLRFNLHRSALPFFTMLRSVTEGGEALPHAMFRVARALNSAYARHLREDLRKFERGAALGECLVAFARRCPSGPATLWMPMLNEAYQAGLPVRSLLRHACALIRTEQQAEAKRRRLRYLALIQGLMAVALPWGIWVAFHFFQPDLLRDFLNEGSGVGCVALALFFQGGGLWVLWRVSSFY